MTSPNLIPEPIDWKPKEPKRLRFGNQEIIIQDSGIWPEGVIVMMSRRNAVAYIMSTGQIIELPKASRRENHMKALDTYNVAKQALFDYFGYVEDYRVIPIEDSRQYFWRLYGEGPGSVRFSEYEKMLDDPEMEYYEDEIYTQRFLPKWVYRGAEFTMVCVDTHTDGNQFLRIFDNAKERPAVRRGAKL